MLNMMAHLIDSIFAAIRQALNLFRKPGVMTGSVSNANRPDMRSKSMMADHRKDMNDLNEVVEQIWHDLNGQVPPARIRQVATGVAAKFKDAPVTTHIPLFVRHLTREWLKEEIRRRT